MKTLTLVQAVALLLLAVIGAYAGHGTEETGCTTPAPAAICDL